MSDKLRACACGGKGLVSPFTDMSVTSISCSKCAKSVAEVGQKAAYDEWNRRSGELKC
jgi:hypothetical protein